MVPVASILLCVGVSISYNVQVEKISGTGEVKVKLERFDMAGGGVTLLSKEPRKSGHCDETDTFSFCLSRNAKAASIFLRVPFKGQIVPEAGGLTCEMHPAGSLPAPLDMPPDRPRREDETCETFEQDCRRDNDQDGREDGREDEGQTPEEGNDSGREDVQP